MQFKWNDNVHSVNKLQQQFDRKKLSSINVIALLDYEHLCNYIGIAIYIRICKFNLPFQKHILNCRYDTSTFYQVHALLSGYRFPVGDGKIYGGVYNAPLQKGAGYDVYYGVGVTLEVCLDIEVSYQVQWSNADR